MVNEWHDINLWNQGVTSLNIYAQRQKIDSFLSSISIFLCHKNTTLFRHDASGDYKKL